MTQLTALKELAEKVEAGTLDGKTPHCDMDGLNLVLAYSGSLDAAHSLHKAVVPEWEWTRYYDGEFGLQKGITFVTAVSTTPGRAWLLAILKAKITELEQ